MDSLGHYITKNLVNFTGSRYYTILVVLGCVNCCGFVLMLSLVGPVFVIMIVGLDPMLFLLGFTVYVHTGLPILTLLRCKRGTVTVLCCVAQEYLHVIMMGSEWSLLLKT